MRHFLCFALAALTGAGCRTESPAAPHDPRDLVVAGEDARHPTAAVDAASGVTYVAYARTEGLDTDVFLTRVEGDVPGEAVQGPPVRVNHLPGDAATHAQAPAQVAVGPDGAVYVAWIVQTEVPGRRFPATDLRLARSSDGGRTFSEAVTVNDDAGVLTGHSFHDLLVGADGAVYVSWLDGRAKDRYRMDHPAPEGSGHGHGHAADPDEPGTEVRVARSTDGGRTFAPSVVVAEGTCECCRTKLALAPDGALYVAWRHQFGPNVRDIALARSDDGGQTFSAPARVFADAWRLDGCPHSGPALAVSTDGRVHVAWYTGARGRTGLHYAVSGDRGATFGAPETIARGVPIAPVALANDGAGGVWLAWEDGPAGAARVAHLEAGAPFDLAGERFDGSAPVLAVAAGRGVLVRTDGGVCVCPLDRVRPAARS